MNIHRYPVKELVSDYIRAGFGVLIPVSLMLFTGLLPLVFYIMMALAVLFGIYGLRTALRQATVLIVDDHGVRQEGPLGAIFDRKVSWARMRDFRLRYFSTRRDGTEGWMQLILRDREGRGSIRIDSHLPGFDDITQQVYEAARDNGLAIDPTSANNLASLGLGDGEVAQAPADGGLPS